MVCARCQDSGMSCRIIKQTHIRGLCAPGARAYSWRRADEPSAPLHRSRTAYYDILKVSPNATQAQIKSAYYEQSFANHPDRNRGEDAARLFALVCEAYGVLGNSSLRSKYDRGILSQTDLQSAGRPPASRRAPRSGRSAYFDFDAFYQAHYGEQLQREQEMKLRREQLEQMQKDRMSRSKEQRMTQVMVFLLCCGAILVSLRV